MSRNATHVVPVPDYKVFRRHFCCCIPVRAGVIFLGLLGLLGGAAVAAIGIVKVMRHGGKIPLIVQIITYLLLSIVSIVGLVGAITRRLKCIKIYFAMLIIHLMASIGTGGFAIRITFQDSPRFESDCRSGSGEQSVIAGCHQAALVLRFFVLMTYLLAWMLSIWASVIVFKYMRQLKDEEAAKFAIKSNEVW